MTKAVTLAELADQNVLSVDGTNNRVGIASTQPTTTLDVGGIVTADSFVGSGANLTDVISGVELKFGGTSVGTAVTAINFSGFSSVTAPVSGLATVTAAKSLTIGVRVGSAVTFLLTGNTFSIPNRAGGNTEINV